MKRLMIIACVVGVLVALPLSHVAMANGGANKVGMCHLNDANDYIDLYIVVIYFGKEISVSGNGGAVCDHESHGDSTHYFAPLPDWAIDLLERFGLDLPNADCVFKD